MSRVNIITRGVGQYGVRCAHAPKSVLALILVCMRAERSDALTGLHTENAYELAPCDE
jgi:hypothetical protein